MKILWVKNGKLLPLDSGGKLRTYHLLTHLCASHELTYLSYYNGLIDKNYEAEIKQHVPGTVGLSTGDDDPTGFRRLIDYLKHVSAPVPYSIGRFGSPKVLRVVTELLSNHSFDVAICDFLASTPNFPLHLPMPTVLFQHNVETLLWERRAKFATRLPERVTARLEYAKMARYEPTQVRRFHHVLAVSEQDRRAMAEMVDPSRISVIPTGVDLAQYRYDPQRQPSPHTAVFAGSMDWEPNIDGVEYFCREIWPIVMAKVPDARFRIVGRSPDARVRRLAGPSVEVTGTVPSVIDHLNEAAVVIVPLRIGGGTRIKIYEGMALGKAVVSTTIGAEGLEVAHQRDIILADDPEQFAFQIVALFADNELRRSYEAAAAASAQRHDWLTIARQFAEGLERIAVSLSRVREFAARER